MARGTDSERRRQVRRVGLFFCGTLLTSLSPASESLSVYLLPLFLSLQIQIYYYYL